MLYSIVFFSNLLLTKKLRWWGVIDRADTSIQRFHGITVACEGAQGINHNHMDWI